jgi:uncharacterized protein (DUF885 family)
MKKLTLLFAVAAFVLISCNSNSSKTEDHSKMNHNDSMPMQDNAMADKDVKMVTATFGNIDPAVSAFMKSLLQNYIDVKNALTNGDESAAKSASDKMSAAMKGFDKSLLSAEQKKVYDDVEDDLKEHAEHIAKSKIDHQRDHFSMMSEDVYNLVKAFGAGMTLYHDHCPMANDNKGAMWLSESKKIRNPYFGEKMVTCGSVEEMFK